MPVEAPPGACSVMSVHSMDTPIGTLWLERRRCRAVQHRLRRTGRARTRADAIEREAESQLRAYFAGELTRFDLPLSPRGTEFQRRVWDAVARVPYGTTTTYSAVAATLGRPSACRAVGAANGRNPLPIVVPCHRVVGASGALTGYGGGLERKRALLDLEAAAG